MTNFKVFNALTLALLMCLSFALITNAQNKLISDICLGCICEAISGCNQTPVCGNGICGAFRITRPYWVDGGKLTLNNENPSSNTAYPNCANDPYCAANTMQNYMSKFGRDCNSDNAVDCYDYAAIHILGPHACRGNVGSQFINVLNNCLATFNIRG